MDEISRGRTPGREKLIPHIVYLATGTVGGASNSGGALGCNCGVESAAVFVKCQGYRARRIRWGCKTLDADDRGESAVFGIWREGR